jgi:hypothetical protein
MVKAKLEIFSQEMPPADAKQFLHEAWAVTDVIQATVAPGDGDRVTPACGQRPLQLTCGGEKHGQDQ